MREFARRVARIPYSKHKQTDKYHGKDATVYRNSLIVRVGYVTTLLGKLIPRERRVRTMGCMRTVTHNSLGGL